MTGETVEPRTDCIRCGECCQGSSPTLQMEDVPILADGFIAKTDVYTIRAGELVHDNIHDRTKITQEEIIKVREKEVGGGCLYFDEVQKSCKIYAHRPFQCKALTCWDLDPFMGVYNGPKASRDEIIRDKTLTGLIQEHERKCNYDRLDGCVKQIETGGERAVERVLEVLKFDYHLRPFVSEKLGIESGEMDFIFGRPLTETIIMFGLKVNKKPDGSFLLTMLDPQQTSTPQGKSLKGP